MFAEVAFPISNFQSFTYVIPKELKKEIQLGSRVLAPFGKRNCQGIILSIKRTTSYSGKIKSIHSLVDDIPVVTPELWKLICWMSNYYMTPIGQVAKTVLPKNLSTRYKPAKRWYVESSSFVKGDFYLSLEKRAPKQFEIYNIIQTSINPIKVSSLKEFVSNPLQICRVLERYGFVKLEERMVLPDSSEFSFEPIHFPNKYRAHTWLLHS